MNPPAVTAPPLPQPEPPTEPMAIISLVLGICGWCAGFTILGWIPAIVCGHIARSKIRMSGNLKGDGYAVAGLAMSYVGLVLCVVLIVVFFGFFFTVFSQHPAVPPVQIRLPQ